jgi:mono/diheme cytochrome c family protein
MPALYSADGGRDYLINVLLFGLQGPIEAAGQNYNGIMPGWSQLSDEEIAAVLNHELTSWGNEELFGEDFMLVSPEDVAAGRDDTLTAQQVHELRGSLDIGQPQEGANASETSEQDTSNPSVTEMQASFTQAQAERGRTDYLRHCADCHGENLAGGEFGGPPLKGSYFMQRWGGNTAAALHGYTSTQMPQDRPGSLSERTYIEILAYILQGNGYPVGQEELEPNLELLQQIIIEPQSDSQ